MYSATYTNSFSPMSMSSFAVSPAILDALRYEIARLQDENQDLRDEKQELRGENQELRAQLLTRNHVSTLRHPNPSRMLTSSCEPRTNIPFELQVLALGAGTIEEKVELSNLSFRFDEGSEKQYLRQFIPYIIEDLRCSIKAELTSITKPAPHRQRAVPIEAKILKAFDDTETVVLVLRTRARAFPKLDHGFNHEAVCLTFRAGASQYSKHVYVLAVASRANSKGDGEETDDESTDSDEFRREWIDFEVKILREQAEDLLHHHARGAGGDFTRLQDKTIHWYWLCGLIPAARMFRACTARTLPAFFPEICEQAPRPWPAAPAVGPTEHVSQQLNPTQTRVVSSISTVTQPGLYNLIGPPGTGKTHTIVHLLAERVRNFPGQKILLTAPSNKAVRVVLTQLLRKVVVPPLVALTGVMSNLPAELEPYAATNFARYLTGPLRSIVQDRVTAANLADAQEQLKNAHFHLISRLKNIINAEGLSVEDSDAETAVKKLLEDVKRLPTKLDRLRRDFPSADQLLDHARKLIKDVSLHHANLEMYLLQKAHVVFTTLVSSGRSNFAKTVNSFDTVIVDEAAQALIPETFIPFKFNPKLFVLIGDPQQLPGTVDHVLEGKHYADSLMTVLTRNQQRPHLEMLTTQYRMHPSINKWISDSFYDGELVAGQSVLQRTSALAILPPDFLLSGVPSAFIDCRFREVKQEGGAISNEEEADVVMRTAMYLLRRGVRPEQIGIITFYAAQVACLQRLQMIAAREDPLMRDVTISTVDGFQGDERDFTLISCVRTGHSVGFLEEFRRINVALSRGKHARWVYGCQAAFRESPERQGERNCVLRNFFAWLDDAQKNNTDLPTVIVDGDALCEALGMQPTPALPTAVVATSRQGTRGGARPSAARGPPQHAR